MSSLYTLALLAALSLSGTAMAQDITSGQWQHQDGRSRIRFTPCGDAVCGAISWLKDPNSPTTKIGEQIFRDMKKDGDGWSGSAYNPEDKRTYTGKMSLSGSTLTTKGCALGGMICKTVTWSRI